MSADYLGRSSGGSVSTRSGLFGEKLDGRLAHLCGFCKGGGLWRAGPPFDFDLGYFALPRQWLPHPSRFSTDGNSCSCSHAISCIRSCAIRGLFKHHGPRFSIRIRILNTEPDLGDVTDERSQTDPLRSNRDCARVPGPQPSKTTTAGAAFVVVVQGRASPPMAILRQ